MQGICREERLILTVFIHFGTTARVPGRKLICTLSSSFWLQGVSFKLETQSNTTRSSTDWLSFSRSRRYMTQYPVDSCTVGPLSVPHQKLPQCTHRTPVDEAKLKPHNDCRHSSGPGMGLRVSRMRTKCERTAKTPPSCLYACCSKRSKSILYSRVTQM